MWIMLIILIDEFPCCAYSTIQKLLNYVMLEKLSEKKCRIPFLPSYILLWDLGLFFAHFLFMCLVIVTHIAVPLLTAD